MTAASTTAGPAPRSFREVWLITLGHTLTHWYPATFYLILPLVGKELGLSYAQIGLVVTVQHVVGALANIPGGMVVDTVGRKNLLLAFALFWIGVPYALMGFTHSYWMLLACVGLVGMGNNIWHPTAIPALAQRYPERKGLVLSVHGMGGNVGDAVAPLVLGALLASFTWRELVFINVVPGVLIAVLILVSLGSLASGAENRRGPRESQSFSQYMAGVRTLLRSRGVNVLILSSVFRSMTHAALITFLPVMLAYEMGYSPFWVGASLFVLQAAGFAATPIAGHLSDRLGRRSILLSTMAMTAVVLVFMALAGRSSAFIFFIALLGFFLYAVRPVFQAWILEIAPRQMAGTSIGIMFGSQAAGSAVSPVVGGMIADAWGLNAVFIFLAATIVIANFFIFFMPRDAEQGRAR